MSEAWPDCYVVSYRIDLCPSASVMHVPAGGRVVDFVDTHGPSRVSRPFDDRASAQALADEINKGGPSPSPACIACGTRIHPEEGCHCSPTPQMFHPNAWA